MKISVSQDALTTALSIVGKAVSTKNTIPVLSGILLSARANSLFLRTTDMELAIQSSVPCSTIVEGEIVLPARYLSDLVRKIPFGDIEIAADYRNYTVTLKWGKSQYVIHGFPADQFPTVPSMDDAVTFVANEKLLKLLFRQTSFAAGHDESKPWLTGVFIKLSQGHLSATATDGVRIAHSQVETDTPADRDFTAIVPSRSLVEVMRLLSDDSDKTVTVAITPNQVFFTLGTVEISSRLLEGQYPDVMRLIPQAYPTENTVSRSEFLEAIERAALITKDGAIRVRLDTDRITITSNTPEVGQVYEEVPAGKLLGDPLDIGFNSKFLVEYLKVLEDAEFRFQCSGSRNPARLQSLTNSSFIYVVLPLITA